MTVSIPAAVAALGRGEVIGLPTETLFGLAADPMHPDALARLIRMKERPADKGFILLIQGQEDLDALVLPPSPVARALMTQFWPGPLTLVLPARAGLSPLLTGGSGFLAVRHSPALPVQALLAAWQGPLISTSANRAGDAPPGTAAEVREIWCKENLLVIDGEIQPDALPSTVVKVAGAQATILRHGAIPDEALPMVDP
ncbi:MAG: L-threonylcarbamoyladenylate synthase [Magnetococcales bacterium]|nr:L-threonylcarbamoyladenylate synthase [Magnetococcales bacterium]